MMETPYTPNEYAKAIYDFSKLESGIGQNFDRLADFLISKGTSVRPETESQAGFMTLYRFDTQSSDGRNLSKAHEIDNWKQFDQLQPYKHSAQENYLIFLKGFPSPQWLRGIGSGYGIDPEFFRRHFDFEACSWSGDAAAVNLPSSMGRMCKLDITTIQTAENVRRRGVSAEQRRRANDSSMETYVLKLLLQDVATGDPIVRHFSTIDATCFAIEQRLSLYLHECGNNWTVFVWLDSSKDLSESSHGPWASPRSDNKISRAPTSLQLQPIIKYKPMLALMAHRILRESSQTRPSKPVKSPQQSACNLPINYGRSLKPDIAACDTTYALREIFELRVQAEAQFLAVCSKKLDQFQATEFSQDEVCLPNLKNLKQLLYRHLNQNQEACASLDTICNPRWPKASDDRMRRRSEAAASALREDFVLVLEKNEQLHKHCTEAINVLMNEIVISESKGARLQAARLGKLTFLAFIFVPLSFTTSFFGMNFQELGANEGALPIYVWFLLSMPLLGFVILFYVYDLSQIWKFASDITRRLLKKDIQDRGRV